MKEHELELLIKLADQLTDTANQANLCIRPGKMHYLTYYKKDLHEDVFEAIKLLAQNTQYVDALSDELASNSFYTAPYYKMPLIIDEDDTVLFHREVGPLLVYTITNYLSDQLKHLIEILSKEDFRQKHGMRQFDDLRIEYSYSNHMQVLQDLQNQITSNSRLLSSYLRLIKVVHVFDWDMAYIETLKLKKIIENSAKYFSSNAILRSSHL